MLNSYRELIVWQKSFDLTIEVYKAVRAFPKSETYGLISQITRATVAIPSNVAEGYARGHRAEYRQFITDWQKTSPFMAKMNAKRLHISPALGENMGFLPSDVNLKDNTPAF